MYEGDGEEGAVWRRSEELELDGVRQNVWAMVRDRYVAIVCCHTELVGSQNRTAVGTSADPSRMGCSPETPCNGRRSGTSAKLIIHHAVRLIEEW